MASQKERRTNEYMIRHVWSTRELAENLIKEVCEEMLDYTFEEEPFYSGIERFYMTSDCTYFSDFDEAVEHELWWLTRDMNEK